MKIPTLSIALTLGLSATAYGANVYVTSSGTGSIGVTTDALVVAALEAGGHTVTVGEQFFNFTGAIDLSGFDVVYLQANWNWNFGNMPADGQQNIFDFVSNGGGLVTNEWTVWKAAAQGSFEILNPYFPAELDTPFSTLASLTFTQVQPDPILNAGLPTEFTFPMTSVSGTHTFIAARPGALSYYNFTQSSQTWGGLIAAGAGCGRVANFATVNAQFQLEDPNFSTLLSNTMTWAAQGPLVTGDANGDGSVDLADLNIVLANFGTTASQIGEDGDVNRDGVVDLADLNNTLSTFGSSCFDG